jgi:hypothetical protein
MKIAQIINIIAYTNAKLVHVKDSLSPNIFVEYIRQRCLIHPGHA